MFRSILYPVKNSLNLSAFSGYCTKAPLQRSKLGKNREINQVRIVGTLREDSYTLKSGTKSLMVQTKESPSTYSNHNVHLKTTADFSAGQRILVQGKLRSTYVPMENGKKITRSIVKAFQLYVFENECASAESSQGDQNHVELLANIASNITEKDFLSTFAVATNYEIRDKESEGVDYHRVLVHDPALREYIKNNLQKSDRVYLSGKIGHMTTTLPDGKRLYSGFVNAENIYKIQRRTRSDEAETNDENTINAEKSL